MVRAALALQLPVDIDDLALIGHTAAPRYASQRFWPMLDHRLGRRRLDGSTGDVQRFATLLASDGQVP
jgi:hypothetical protein